MKKRILFFGTAICLIAGTLIASSGGRNDGRSGSPLDGSSCTACHSGVANQATGWITTNIPNTGYVAGQTYTITCTGTHTGAAKFGFQITAETATAKIGTFIVTNSTTTKLANSNAAVSQTSQGTTVSNNSASWSMNWTAPASGSGTVTFYAAFNAANGNGSTSGDQIYLESLQFSESTVDVPNFEQVELNLSPNPASNYVSLKSAENIESVNIFNVSGKLIRSITQDITKKIDVSDLKNGNYIFVIKTGGNSISKKVIIQK